MATPIAHKGAVAGAKAMALTVLDLLVRPELIEQAWTYFRDVQTRETRYTPFIGPRDVPQTWMNRKTMETYREQQRRFYYDPARYPTYLEQLGIRYPTLRSSPAGEAAKPAEGRK
jgi:aminobenzoyl-glutamate utilization protein B